MKTLMQVLLLLILILLSSPLASQELSSLEDIRSYALENSLDYKKAQWEAVKAGHNLEGLFTMDETSFSASSGYDDSLEKWSASAGVEVPLVDQLSVNSTVYEDNSGSVGLTFTPLSHSDDRVQNDISWQKAAALADEMAVTVENSALSAALGWMNITAQLAVQEESVLVSETIYRDEKIRYEAGESTLDDVRDALVDWTEARTTLTGLQTQLRAKESDLITALNVNPETVELSLLSSEDLAAELEALKSSISPEDADPVLSHAVFSSYLDMRSVEEELDDTRLFDPELNLSSDLYFGDDNKSWEASVTLSFSLQDWQSEERQELQTDLEISRQAASLAEQESRLLLQQARIALENTAQNREVAELEKEQVSDLYEEAQFLFELGEYSQAERDDAALSLESAEISLFSALADEYLAWREILLYLP
jgi:outer membrane protein TolC